MKKGDDLLVQLQPEKAIELYKQAADIDPLRPEPKAKIEECQKLMDQQADMKEKEAAYNNYMKRGGDYMLAKDFLKAKELFGKALEVKPGDATAAAKRSECDKYIAAGNEKLYNDEVAAGDAFFLKKDFPAAIEHYKKAQELKPAEDYPKFQLKLSEKSMAWQKQNEEFTALVTAGSKAYEASEFDNAVRYYNEAIAYIGNAKENKSKFKPGVEELNKRIDEANKAKENKSKPVAVEKKDSGNVVKPLPAGEAVDIRVQFAQSEKPLDLKTARYKGIEKISSYTMNGMLKYTAGSFTTVEDAAAYRDKLKQMGFKDAFLVAFRNGQRIEIKVAVDLLSQKKNP